MEPTGVEDSCKASQPLRPYHGPRAPSAAKPQSGINALPSGAEVNILVNLSASAGASVTDGPEPLTIAGARHRVSLLGIPVDALTMEETIELARAMIRSGVPHQQVGINAALLVESEDNAELRRVIEGCDLISADGMSAVFVGRLFGRSLPERVAGVDLFQRLVEAAHRDNSSVYFLGATDEVVERVAAVFSERHPGLRIAGYRNGYWDDDREVVSAVRAADPDYLFLAISSPRKELWLDRYLAELDVPFAMGVGGSFDVIAGKVRRAPRWVQNAGFEWAWRLGQEPRRMWRRYLFSNAAFIRSVAREYWRARK